MNDAEFHADEAEKELIKDRLKEALKGFNTRIN